MVKRLDNLLVRPRLYLGVGLSIGPGKIELLRKIGETHSISAAARELGIPYKRAWILVDTLNKGFAQPVVSSSIGGRHGGGAALTEVGQDLLDQYDQLETRIAASVQPELAALQKLAKRQS